MKGHFRDSKYADNFPGERGYVFPDSWKIMKRFQRFLMATPNLVKLDVHFAGIKASSFLTFYLFKWEFLDLNETVPRYPARYRSSKKTLSGVIKTIRSTRIRADLVNHNKKQYN